MIRFVIRNLIFVVTAGHLAGAERWQESNPEELLGLIIEAQEGQSSSATWKKFNSPYLHEFISLTDTLLENSMAATDYGATELNPLSDLGFKMRPGYNEEISRLEIVRTILLVAAYDEVYENIHTAAFDGSTTVEDLVNFHTLVNYSQNRPSEVPRHSEWIELGNSSDPLYRLAAIELIWRTWPDTVNEVESELNEFTFEVALARRNQISNYADDQNMVVARIAREKLELLDASIDQLKKDFGFSEVAAAPLNPRPVEGSPLVAAPEVPVPQAPKAPPSVAPEESEPLRWPLVLAGVALLGILVLLARVFSRGRTS